MNNKKNNDRFKLIPAVHIFLIKGNKILLLRRFNTGYRDGQYSVPAGHLDGKEKTTNAACRELKEETGIKINPKQLNIAHIMHRMSEEERIDFFFTVKNWKGSPEITEIDKCDELKWFLIKKLPPNMVPYIKKAIQNHNKNILYSEFGWIIQDEK